MLIALRSAIFSAPAHFYSGWAKAWREVNPSLKVLATFLCLGVVLNALFVAFLDFNEKYSRRELLITVGLLGAMRVLWSIINACLAFYYRLVIVPGLRREASSLPHHQQFPERIYFIIPTVREELTVTRRQLKSILREAVKIPSRVTVVYAMADETEHEIVRGILKNDPRSSSINVLLTVQTSKRDGMARALRLARADAGSDVQKSRVVLMDGDTVMGPDLLLKTLPLFEVRPKLGGLTVANYGMARGAGPWFRDFYNLRFASSSHYMSAIGVFNCIFSLTGRFSMVRGEIGLTGGFIDAVENDSIDDFIQGKIKLVTGDDKSTWFYLRKQGWDMIALPDVYAYAMENAGRTPFKSTTYKLHRWIGNMLRFNARSLSLGPRGIGGLWVWLTVLDQRIRIWTSLVGLIAALILSFTFTPLIFPVYLSAVILRRLLYLWMLQLEGNQLTMRYLPILMFSQWYTSLIKIWILSDISKQAWTRDRVGKSQKSAADQSRFWPVMTSQLYITCQVTVFLYVVLQLTLMR